MKQLFEYAYNDGERGTEYATVCSKEVALALWGHLEWEESINAIHTSANALPIYAITKQESGEEIVVTITELL